MKRFPAFLAIALACVCPAYAQYNVTFPSPPVEKVRTVYTTDLYYAPWDADDMFDATVCYALGETYSNIQGFVMDEPFGGWDGSLPSRGDGRTWQGIYNIAVGRDVPYYHGLPSFLSSPSDDSTWQGAFHCEGRDAILNVLSSSPDNSVMLTAVGSMRDIAAAYNHSPALFTQKVNRIYTSGGREGDFRDANWGSDPNAAIGLLNSGVDMYVAFCGEGNHHDGSSFYIDLGPHISGMDATNPKLSQLHFWGWYGCMDGGYRSAVGDPFPNRPPLPDNIKPPTYFDGNNTMANPGPFFDEPIPQDKLDYMKTRSRILWSMPCFLDAAGLKVFKNGLDVKLSYNDTEPGWERVYFFRPAEFTLNGYDFQYTPTTEQNANIHMFNWETTTKGEYQNIMEAVYQELIETYLPGEEPPPPPPEDVWMDHEIKYVNGKYGITFTIKCDDGIQSAIFAKLTYEGVNGGVIEQIQAFGTTQVDDEVAAEGYDGFPAANYEMDEDSWFMDEFAGSLASVQVLTDNPNYYHIESGTPPGEIYGDVAHAYIVCTGDVQFSGQIGRAQWWPASGVIEVPPPGDANWDFYVDGLDYVIWANNYGQADVGWVGADYNGDGTVDGLDYVLWANFYNPQQPGGAVPEPATLALLAAGGCLVLLRRKRRR